MQTSRPAQDETLESDDSPRESGVSAMGLILAVLIMVLLNAAAGLAFWYYKVQPMQVGLRRHREQLKILEDSHRRLTGDLTKVREDLARTPLLSKRVDELQRAFDQIAAEIASRLDPSGHSPQSGHQPAAFSSSLRRESAPANDPAADRPSADQPSDHAPAPRTPGQPLHERLGAWFVQEIGRSVGMEPASIWDRWVSKIRAEHRDIRCQQLHWDRAAAVPHFQDRPSAKFTDTGECWLVQEDSQSWLFFPALAQQHARRNDLPGCQIISPGGVLLDASKLAMFTPPVVSTAPEGWTILTEGIVEYH